MFNVKPPKYPDIRVNISNANRNAFAILLKVKVALIDAEVSYDEIKAWYDEATSDDFDHLIKTCMEMVTIEEN